MDYTPPLVLPPRPLLSTSLVSRTPRSTNPHHHGIANRTNNICALPSPSPASNSSGPTSQETESEHKYTHTRPLTRSVCYPTWASCLGLWCPCAACGRQNSTQPHVSTQTFDAWSASETRPLGSPSIECECKGCWSSLLHCFYIQSSHRIAGGQAGRQLRWKFVQSSLVARDIVLYCTVST